MATPTTTTELANIATYMWTANLLQSNAFNNGSMGINRGRDIVLLVENAALTYGVAQGLADNLGIGLDVYRLVGQMLQPANEVLVNGSGGIIVNPSTQTGSIVYYQNRFTVGDTGAPILDGELSWTVNIGTGRIWSAQSVTLSRDQSLLPQDENPNLYVTYIPTYDTVTGLVTITLGQIAQTSQLYILSFSYIVV